MTTAIWAQDHRHVFLSVKIKGAAAAGEPEFSFQPETVRVQAAGAQFEAQLFGPIEPDHPDTNASCKPNSVELVLRKAKKGFWPGLLAGGKKDRAITVDWDKWVDEDECEDDQEGDCECEPVSAFDPTEAASLESSPIDGEVSDQFCQLNPNEKMLLLSHMWNGCDQDQREVLMSTFKSILDSSSEDGCQSADLKGSGLLGDRDLSQFPPDVKLPHVEQWLKEFGTGGTEQKVGSFTKCWGWCNDEEKRLVMAGLTR